MGCCNMLDRTGVQAMADAMGFYDLVDVGHAARNMALC